MNGRKLLSQTSRLPWRFFAISNLNLNVSFGGLLRQTKADCRETQKQSF